VEVEVEVEEDKAAEKEGTEGGVSSGLRIMCLWCEIGLPLLNMTLQDLKNYCEEQCIRWKALHCWENLRNVHGKE